MDDYSPFNQTKTRNPFARPYPPPPKPKSQPTDVDAGWAPGTGPPRLSDVASRPNTLKADAAKRDAVVDAFRYAWSANEKDAFSDDEYHPISHRGSNLGSGAGIGYTVVDALDTMLLMGLESEYTRARTWVQEKLSFERPGYFSTFQVRSCFQFSGARCGDGVRVTYCGAVCPVGAGRRIRRSRRDATQWFPARVRLIMRVLTEMGGVLMPTRLGDELRTRAGGGSRSFPTIPYVVIRFNELLRME
ncbi:glycoside hydrolase [Mycena olivaceomarginata]|nr:glycoside hydrolase [Mycena olivaceomarginata]